METTTPAQLGLKNTTLSLDQPLLMGIVNIPPDSFSDGGKAFDTDQAMARIAQLIHDGADIIDIGAESTRPGATPISAEEEQSRLAPILSKYFNRFDTPLSLDTTKATVAKWGLEQGVSIINDISGGQDINLVSAVADHEACLVIMHMQGSPETMQDKPNYPEGILASVKGFLAHQIKQADSMGVASIIIDPGIGFGKTLPDNLALIKTLDSLTDLGQPILLGTSNKSFIGALDQSDVSQRVGGSVASTILGWQNGAQLFRVHDIQAHKQAFTVCQAIMKGSAI